MLVARKTKWLTEERKQGTKVIQFITTSANTFVVVENDSRPGYVVQGMLSIVCQHGDLNVEPCNPGVDQTGQGLDILIHICECQQNPA